MHPTDQVSGRPSSALATPRRPLSFPLLTCLALLGLAIVASPAQSSFQFAEEWGGQFSGEVQFDQPSGIAAHPDTAGVYVADADHHRIQRLQGALAAELTPASVDFGQVRVMHGAGPETFRFENNGDGPVVMAGVGVTGPGAPQFFLEDDCHGALGIGDACEIDVGVVPLSAGPHQAQLEVTSNAPESPHTASVSVVGVPAHLPAALSLDRAAMDRGRLAVRGSLHPAAAGERVVMRLRTRAGQVRTASRVRADGRFGANERLRGRLARAQVGVLDVLFQGNDELRRQHARVRAAQVSPRLQLAQPRTRGNALSVRGRVHPRLAGRLTLELHFNRADGSPASQQTRVRTDRRGRFELRGRSPAARDPRARVGVIHPGKGRAYGQVADRGLRG